MIDSATKPSVTLATATEKSAGFLVRKLAWSMPAVYAIVSLHGRRLWSFRCTAFVP